MARLPLPAFDVWVCQGRMCTANGADAVAAAVARAKRDAADGETRCRTLRGGCYGLCDIGPNVVVRRYVGEAPDVDADRLSLTESPDEVVYSRMGPADAPQVVHAHLEDDAKVPHLTKEAVEAREPPDRPIAARLRALRERRSRR